MTETTLHAGLLCQTAGGLVEVSGAGYSRIPASRITEALQDERAGAVFRWPDTEPTWEPWPPTHVGIFTDPSAGAPRTAIALPSGTTAEGTAVELSADALREVLVGA